VAKPPSIFTFRFLTAASLMIAAAVGLRPATSEVARRMQKLPIPLRRVLSEFDTARLETFRPFPENASRTMTLPRGDLSDEFGTHQYVLVSLQDELATPPRGEALLIVSYYSNPQDKVPHTPEVCYRQRGTVVESMSTLELDAPELGPRHGRLRARLLNLRDGQVPLVVVYVFCASGQFCYDREQVRWIIGRPGDRYVYFSKIEAVTTTQGDPAGAAQRCLRLLREALPLLVNNHFPDPALFKH